MAKSIRPILSPLLLVSYVCGLRIVEFPADRPRFWFSLLYILLLWSVHCFFVLGKLISHVTHDSSEYKIYISLNIFTALLSIFLGVCHDKKFRNCLKKLAVVDDTLEKIGTMMDCQRLSKRIVWMVSGWFVIALLLNYCDYLRWREHVDVLTSIYLTLMINYCPHINIINDLIFASILGYIGLKFDQVNEHLHKLVTENIHGTKRTWESPALHSCQLPNIPSSKYMTWIIIHLHLELHKISLEINSMFEVEMTFKMACYFGFIAEFFRQFLSTFFIRHYIPSRAILVAIIVVFWLIWHIFRLLLINYICERVSVKANITGDVISRISYFICDVEVRENILQFLLQLRHMPLRFHGLGLFQFGTKFFYRYFESILTLGIIIIQTDRFKHALKNYV